MAENGEDKLIATVHHIVKTLGRTDTMTKDILKVFSTYDGRLSLDKLYGLRDSPASLSPSAPAPSTDDPRHTVERTLRALDRQISQFVASDRLIWSVSADAEAFLEAIDDLLATVHDLDAAGNKPLLDRADELLQRCVFRLEEEFRSLIECPDGAAPEPPSGPGAYESEDTGGEEDEEGGGQNIPIAPPVADFDIVIDALSPGSIADLQKIARRMVDAGFGRECAEAYIVARRSFVEESVARLGIRPRKAEEVQAASWDELEHVIARWIPAFQMVFHILIPSERRLCDRVFENLAPYGDLAFTGTCRPPAIQLLSFADAVAASSRTPERLFRVIDMYEAVRDLLPDLDPLFADHYSASLGGEVAAVCNALGTAIKGIFMELENLIRRDPARSAVPGGAVHPITRYVMNYLLAACGSRQTLEEVMEGDFGAAAAVDPDRPTSSLAVHIAWIMDVLRKNLESKSKIYPEPALSCIFLMNNGHYIIQKVKDSELAVLLGEEWVKQLKVRVRRWSGEYQRATWGKVVAILQTGGGGGGAATSAKTMLERLKVFNNYLGEICRVQAGWVVVDDQLRSDIRTAVQDLVLPAYTNFVGRLRGMRPEAGRGACFKYTAEDVEARIRGLLEGDGSKVKEHSYCVP